MDVYTLICLCSVFAALVEYAVISYLSIYIGRYKAKEVARKEKTQKIILEEEKEEKQEEGEDENEIKINGKFEAGNLFTEPFKIFLKLFRNLKCSGDLNNN